VEVDRDTALSYLRKQDINITAEQGWNEIRYEGLGLGWIKALPNRINNYYPSEWRILKS
jgi:NOL1/NOP2/fmu family ribosome biogenesis protein